MSSYEEPAVFDSSKQRITLMEDVITD